MGRKRKKNKKQIDDNELFSFENEIVIGINKLPDENKKEKKKLDKKGKKTKKNKKEEKINYIKPEIKSKVKNKHKTKNFKRKKRIKVFLIGITLITVILAIISFLIFSPIFNITEITVENNKQISKEEIIDLSGINIGDNIFRISKNITERKMKQNSYIESIQLDRKLPSKLSIIVKERIATYILQIDETSFAYINNQGYILEINSQIANLPQITSYTTEELEVGSRLNNEDLEKLEVVLKIMNIANSNQIGNLITSIDIKDKDNYVLRIESEKKTIYFGGQENINTKILSIKKILEYEKGVEGEIFMNGDINKEGEVLFREKV